MDDRCLVKVKVKVLVGHTALGRGDKGGVFIDLRELKFIFTLQLYFV